MAGVNERLGVYQLLKVPQALESKPNGNPASDVGATFRKGAASSAEYRAKEDGKLEQFYPSRFINNAGSDPIAAAPGKGDRGILLSCSGNTLMRAGEKLYMEAVDHIDIKSKTSAFIVDEGLNIEVGTTRSIKAKEEVKQIQANIKTDVGGNSFSRIGGAKTVSIEGPKTEKIAGPDAKISGSPSTILKLAGRSLAVVGIDYKIISGTSISVISGLDLKATPVNIGIYGQEVKLVVNETKVGGQYTKVKANVLKLLGVTTEAGGVETKVKGITSGASGVKADTAGASSITKGAGAETVGAEAKTGGALCTTSGVDAMCSQGVRL